MDGCHILWDGMAGSEIKWEDAIHFSEYSGLYGFEETDSKTYLVQTGYWFEQELYKRCNLMPPLLQIFKHGDLRCQYLEPEHEFSYRNFAGLLHWVL